jgi:hypothetical protein
MLHIKRMCICHLNSESRELLMHNLKKLLNFELTLHYLTKRHNEQNNPKLGEEEMLEDTKAGGRISGETRNWLRWPKP